MNWDEAIEEAKEELGIFGWTNRWDKVVSLAKQKYWEGDSFKDLKEQTLSSAGNSCKICDSVEKLTAHHIHYGRDEETICVCNNCHHNIHKIQDKYGFVMQLTLLYWEAPEVFIQKYPNLIDMSWKCRDLLSDASLETSSKILPLQKTSEKIVKDPKECRRIWEEDMRKADLEIAKTIRDYQEKERKKGKRK